MTYFDYYAGKPSLKHGDVIEFEPLVEEVTLETPRIRTEYDPKPIPFRGCDWVATFDGYEPGAPIGYGATEEEAIDSLMWDAEVQKEMAECHAASRSSDS